MPTFREDLHLGHELVMIGTEDINNAAITTEKLADGAITTEKLADASVTTPKIADDAITSEKIKDGEVKTPDIADGAVTPDKLSDSVITDVINPIVKKVDNKYKDITDDLQNQIDSLEVGGIAVSNRFGDDPHISVSQKTLTQAINAIWYKLEEITGETLIGINLTVTPEYYIGEGGCTVNIAAETIDEHGIFEDIVFKVNDVIVSAAENVHELEYNYPIEDTSVIKCEAHILGVLYERSVTITRYSPFWVGAGNSSSSVMTMDNIRPATANMRGNYNITFTSGQKLFVVVENVIRDRFVRADMNGVEIQFTETTETIDGKTYKVLTSENTYQAGTYNIDINS